MMRRVGAVVVATLALAGCRGTNEVDAGHAEPAGGNDADDADEVVADAFDAVLGDGPFRSRTTGQIPFFGALTGAYEQSGTDLLQVEEMGSYALATVIVGQTAYEWHSSDQSWMDTPLDEFDPLMGPGTGYWLTLFTAFDTSTVGAASDSTPHETTPDEPPVSPTPPDLPEVATGWTEVGGDADGGRRFERTLPFSSFLGDAGWPDGVPVERQQENSVVEEFSEHAELTAIVELDRAGNLARYIVRSEFDGSAAFPQCEPLDKMVGTIDQVTEFSDVGTEFTISVPEPAEMVERFPKLGQQPDLSDDDVSDIYDGAFINDAGERDLTGCPTP